MPFPRWTQIRVEAGLSPDLDIQEHLSHSVVTVMISTYLTIEADRVLANCQNPLFAMAPVEKGELVRDWSYSLDSCSATGGMICARGGSGGCA